MLFYWGGKTCVTFICFRLKPLIWHLPQTCSNSCCNMKVESTLFLEVRCFLCLLKLSIQVMMSTLNCKEENHIRLFLRHRVNWHKYELSVNIVVFVAWPDDCDSHLQCCPIYSIKKELCLTLLGKLLPIIYLSQLIHFYYCFCFLCADISEAFPWPWESFLKWMYLIFFCSENHTVTSILKWIDKS